MATLQQRLLQLNSFRRRLTALTIDSVRLGLPIDQGDHELSFATQIDWPYMLLCASALSYSAERDAQDAALRIAHHCLTLPSTRDEHRIAAMVILECLANAPAIALALERGCASSRYVDAMPVPLHYECVRRRIDHSILEADGKLLYLNRFQSLVYKSAFQSDWISISAPTSAGKSFVLLKLLQEYLSHEPVGHFVYVVPTRALIKQVEADLTAMVAQSSVQSVLVTSVPQVPKTEATRVIFVFTQERLHYLLNEIGPEFAFNLLVIDEAQKIDDGARGVLLQQTIESVVRRSSQVRVIFCSPMTANPELFLEDAGAQKRTQCISSEVVTVNQNLIWASQVQGKPKEWKLLLCMKEESVPLETIHLPYSPSTSKRLPYVAFAMSDKSGGSLVYANTQAEAEKTALQLTELLRNETVDDPELDALGDLVARVVHEKYPLVTTLKHRVAFHYGNMPLLIRNEIERLFKSGKIRFLVCTSTLIEGVNLPAKSIFLRSPKRGIKTPLDETGFWNLAGRAGRWGKEFQGNVVCVDVESWKTSPPRTKPNYRVERALDAIAKQPDDFLTFITSGTPRDIAAARPDWEHAFVYFVKEWSKNQTITDEGLLKRYGAGFIAKINQACSEAMAHVTIPYLLIERNPGVSPVAQQNLLDYFQSFEGNVDKLIPYPPEDREATKESYLHVVGRISRFLSGDSQLLVWPQAILVVNWMRGYTLARIIEENWSYWRDKGKSLPSVIRKSMQDIEEYARFKFVKYANCYLDVLRYYLNVTGRAEMVNRIPQLHIFLEFGACQTTQISLMDLGLSRISAIALSEIIAETELTREQCAEWIKSRDIETLNLSSIIVEDINQAKARFLS